MVSANLLRIAEGRTMIIVSHRLSSLIECDLILVMEQGKVADIAPHNVLLERCAMYRQLWTQQNRHLERQGLVLRSVRGSSPVVSTHEPKRASSDQGSKRGAEPTPHCR